MDYHNRAGSKKGGGGIATESQFNTQRRKQVESLLSDQQEIPFTFQSNNDESDNNTRQNPYIYKNHSGKLVCKLCNTMHMSWTSVERHLQGKKHGLNVIRRNNALGEGKLGGANGLGDMTSKSALQFQKKVEAMKLELTYTSGLPKYNAVNIKDPESGNIGIAMRVKYEKPTSVEDVEAYPPFLRVVTGLELQNAKDREKKFIVIAYPPFENVALEIPASSELIGGVNRLESSTDEDEQLFVDELNRNCTYWDSESRTFFIQIYFKKETQPEDTVNIVE
ncbi:hypothetical protein C6P44_001219 [Monosporozyma unispora]|nr:hypothetical protein C6P44_001219 [Kazachstania unispora]